MEAAPQDQGRILSVSPELIHHVLDGNSGDYTRGYRDGVTGLSSRLGSVGEAEGMASAAAPPIFQHNAQFTWGIQAVQANSSPFTGQGIKVAVLDTGFDSNHPDFAGRNVTTRSFIQASRRRTAMGTELTASAPNAGRRTLPAGGGMALPAILIGPR